MFMESESKRNAREMVAEYSVHVVLRRGGHCLSCQNLYTLLLHVRSILSFSRHGKPSCLLLDISDGLLHFSWTFSVHTYSGVRDTSTPLIQNEALAIYQ